MGKLFREYLANAPAVTPQRADRGRIHGLMAMLRLLSGRGASRTFEWKSETLLSGHEVPDFIEDQAAYLVPLQQWAMKTVGQRSNGDAWFVRQE